MFCFDCLSSFICLIFHPPWGKTYKYEGEFPTKISICLRVVAVQSQLTAGSVEPEFMVPMSSVKYRKCVSIESGFHCLAVSENI